jgi:uncharacterized damage-inducible protein DinB
MVDMNSLSRLLDHLIWADERIHAALRAAGSAVPAAEREVAHILGSEENWLARMEGRSPRAAIWPEERGDDLARLVRQTHDGFRSYLAARTDVDLDASVTYTNSAGQTFTGSVREILLHVFLHAQYHRGKVNLMLRQGGFEPAPTDFIAFSRGVPAATERPPQAPPESSPIR